MKEVARLFQAFADRTSLEHVSMKANRSSSVLLQKPGKRSKTKDHICHLKRRLDLWHNGDIRELLDDIRELLDEGRSIQARLMLASNDLCDALAAVGRRICSSDLHPDDLSALVACRLIPLNKINVLV